MPPKARVVIPGVSHPVTQRGNRRQDVFFGEADWQRYLALPWLREPDDPEGLAALRPCTRTGRPVGEEAFLRPLERIAARRLRPQPVARPRKPGRAAK